MTKIRKPAKKNRTLAAWCVVILVFCSQMPFSSEYVWNNCLAQHEAWLGVSSWLTMVGWSNGSNHPVGSAKYQCSMDAQFVQVLPVPTACTGAQKKQVYRIRILGRYSQLPSLKIFLAKGVACWSYLNQRVVKDIVTDAQWLLMAFGSRRQCRMRGRGCDHGTVVLQNKEQRMRTSDVCHENN